MPRGKSFDEERILTKAMELFWKKGFHATSMQNLVDFLGINRASIYDTFGDKERLFERAFEKYRQTNKTEIKQFLSNEQNTIDALKELFRKSLINDINDLARKGCMVVNTSTELANSVPEISICIQNNHSEFVEIFREAIQEAISKGRLAADSDANALAEFLFTYYNGMKVIVKTENNYNKLLSSLNTAFTVFDH